MSELTFAEESDLDLNTSPSNEKMVRCPGDAEIIDNFDLLLPCEESAIRNFVVCDFRSHRRSIFYRSTGTSNKNKSQFNGTYFQTAGILLGDCLSPILNQTNEKNFRQTQTERSRGHVVKMSDINLGHGIRNWQARFIFFMIGNPSIFPNTTIKDLIYVVKAFYEFEDLQTSVFIGSHFWSSCITLRSWILGHDYIAGIQNDEDEDKFYIEEVFPERMRPFTVCDKVINRKTTRILDRESSESKIEELFENGTISYAGRESDKSILESNYPIEDKTQIHDFYKNLLRGDKLNEIIEKYPGEKQGNAYETIRSLIDAYPISKQTAARQSISRWEEEIPTDDEGMQPPEGDTDTQPPGGGGTVRKLKRKINNKTRKKKTKRITRKNAKRRKTRRRKTIYKHHTK